jgi:hypothetical protein
MNTNTIKCELCKEPEDKEYYLDDLRVCRNCYEEAQNIDADIIGERQENFCN